jgi:RNA polymerase sigma-70 factor (ECF subfamily)
MKDLKFAIKRAKNQEQKAFNEIFNSYWEYLYSFQLKRTTNKELAEEISIMAFARAFDRIETFDSSYDFKTWLSTISKNIQIDLIRKKNKKSAIKTISMDDDYEASNTNTHPSPEEILITNQSIETLLSNIKTLKQDYRKILKLRFFEDLSYKEISKKLDQPINTIKVKLLRAKNLLTEKTQKDIE